MTPFESASSRSFSDPEPSRSISKFAGTPDYSAAAENIEDMIHYTTKFRFQTNPNCKPNFKFSKKTREKRRYEMHQTGWYIDLRIVFTPSFEHEIPNLVYNLVSLEKKFGAIVNWVLKI